MRHAQILSAVCVMVFAATASAYPPAGIDDLTLEAQR